MRVFIDTIVHDTIERFYSIALELHPALDEVTVLKKINRLYSALESLGDYPHIYAKARYKTSWQEKGYREFICEDFHFAFQIYTLETGERIVRVHEAVHSLLYHNPEDESFDD